jgi:nucleoside-triphosphatase
MFRIAVTGKPGIGKTTFCLRIYNALKDKMDICGFITLEVREKGRRIGFKLKDLKTGEEDWLAKVSYPSEFRVGRYGVVAESIDRFAKKIDSYSAELVIIDEVGPMELKSLSFVKSVEKLIESKSCLFSIHLKSQHPLLRRIRKDFEVFMLNESNRDWLVDKIVRRIIDASAGARG